MQTLQASWFRNFFFSVFLASKLVWILNYLCHVTTCIELSFLYADEGSLLILYVDTDVCLHKLQKILIFIQEKSTRM